MNRKKEFTSPAGHEGMIIDCDTYNVEIFKSIDKERYVGKIKFTNKKTSDSCFLNRAFIIDWDKEEDGGRLSIHYKDRWGSEMAFIHYDPSDIKGMFDFIAKGYNIYQKLI